jgi:hypothetical protein
MLEPESVIVVVEELIQDVPRAEPSEIMEDKPAMMVGYAFPVPLFVE